MWPEKWTEGQKTYAASLRWAQVWELRKARLTAGEMRAGNYGEEKERWEQVIEVLDYVLGMREAQR